ncbi:class I SAM-dependent methyltransferase [Nocardioides sp. Root190]|uniref:class I SAM-dependent methyltransferase n=1 Tax=Nocardioides sp. Root190 TaxID=1736488 RepID=UPI000A4912F6|nr:class I SAM-dependent methyltransferase [Nocardioides sp. Root190]
MRSQTDTGSHRFARNGQDLATTPPHDSADASRPTATDDDQLRTTRSKNAKRRRRTVDDLAWLRGRPTLNALIERFPSEWQAVRREVASLVARNDVDDIQVRIIAASLPAQTLPGSRVRPARERVAAEVHRQMTVHLLKDAILRSSTGVNEGRIRFNLANGYIAQKLLFRRDLERKPVSIRLFRLIWPMLNQRRLLMPLVQPKGIWCFYSSRLVSQLAEMIGDRACLEIAAGDGTLSRFLAKAGVNVTATDNYSWDDSIDFPSSVIRQDARTALREHRPQVVICSWPPAGNHFEQHVFSTASVELYIVISSTNELSTGNWASYRRQETFDLAMDERMSKLVLPPEVAHGVYVFRRRPSDNVVSKQP